MGQPLLASRLYMPFPSKQLPGHLGPAGRCFLHQPPSVETAVWQAKRCSRLPLPSNHRTLLLTPSLVPNTQMRYLQSSASTAPLSLRLWRFPARPAPWPPFLTLRLAMTSRWRPMSPAPRRLVPMVLPSLWCRERRPSQLAPQRWRAPPPTPLAMSAQSMCLLLSRLAVPATSTRAACAAVRRVELRNWSGLLQNFSLLSTC